VVGEKPLAIGRVSLCPDRRFQFQKLRQPLIRVTNETLSVVAVRIGNEDCFPARINGCDTAQTETGLAELIRYGDPILHTADLCLVYSRQGNDKMITKSRR
jgi:hypothetical protein